MIEVVFGSRDSLDLADLRVHIENQNQQMKTYDQ